jgi:hypothetical protein
MTGVGVFARGGPGVVKFSGTGVEIYGGTRQ